MNSLNSSMFHNWKGQEGGYEDFEYEPGSIPYVVRVSGKHHIPINAIVFADSPDAARTIVLLALEWKSGLYRARVDKYGESDANRCQQFLGQLESGELTIDVDRYNARIISKVQWASNDTVG